MILNEKSGYKGYYLVRLKNKNQDLDLRTKEKEIRDAIDLFIFSPKKPVKLVKCEIVKLDKQAMQIFVEETTDTWHPTLGKELANRYGMRNFCVADNPSMLFDWQVFSR